MFNLIVNKKKKSVGKFVCFFFYCTDEGTLMCKTVSLLLDPKTLETENKVSGLAHMHADGFAVP